MLSSMGRIQSRGLGAQETEDVTQMGSYRALKGWGRSLQIAQKISVVCFSK